MPMIETLLFGLAAVVAAIVAARASPRLRADLRRPWAPAAIALAAAGLSLLSALHAAPRHAGTGISTDRGWPKPFLFRWESWESAATAGGFNALYFAGNACAWALPVVAVWIALRLLRR